MGCSCIPSSFHENEKEKEINGDEPKTMLNMDPIEDDNLLTAHTNQNKEHIKEESQSFQIEFPNNYIEISNEDFESSLPFRFQKYIKENNTEIKNLYKGDLKKLKFNPKPIKLSNQNIYYGYWNNKSQMEGPGLLYLKDQKVLCDGLWKNGILYYGKIFLSNRTYTGEIKDNEYNGKGKMEYLNGEIYEGNWLKKKRNGYGILIYNDKCKYIGNFKNDKFEGEGEFFWNNGYYYKGNFKNGLFEGEGLLKSPNGSFYKGNFEKGLYHGNGMFIWGNNNKNSKGNSFTFPEKYRGEFAFGKKEGKGIYQFENGDLFNGNFFDNLPQGKGEYKTQDKSFKGIWKCGELLEKPDSDDIDIPDLDFKMRDFDIDLKLEHLNNEINLSSNIFGLGGTMKPKDNLVSALI